MAQAGICPKCDRPVTELNIAGTPLKHQEKAWHGITYSCPFCNAILGVSFDPFAMMEDIANKVVAKQREVGPLN